MTFQDAKRRRDELEAALSAVNYPAVTRSATGLPCEADRLSAPYQAARAAEAKAMKALQDFNKVFVKQFKKELKRERDERLALANAKYGN